MSQVCISGFNILHAITSCRVSAVVHACVGHLETDGVGTTLHVTEKRRSVRDCFSLKHGELMPNWCENDIVKRISI